MNEFTNDFDVLLSGLNGFESTLQPCERDFIILYHIECLVITTSHLKTF